MGFWFWVVLYAIPLYPLLQILTFTFSSLFSLSFPFFVVRREGKGTPSPLSRLISNKPSKAKPGPITLPHSIPFGPNDQAVRDFGKSFHPPSSYRNSPTRGLKSMGNVNSSGGNGRRRNGSRRSHPTPPPPAPPQPEISANRYVFAAATPYPAQYPNPNPPQYYQYPGYYPPPPPAMPVPLPAPYDHHHRGGAHMDPANWGRYPYGPMMPPAAPYVEHQKAVTIRNDVNLKKETLRLEPDEENPGRFLVSFTFDATVAGSVTVIFFAKEGEDCNLTPMKEDILPPVTVHFEQGLGQKFRQPSGTGIGFSMFEESELLKVGEADVFPLAVKAEALPVVQNGSDENPVSGTMNSQITQAVFEKEKGEYQVRVVKQILWVKGMRYELQEIYGIGNSVDGDVDANDPGKECVICLSEPRDTTVLPCRHMCMCSGCAKVLRFQTNRCPICRQPVERLLEIKVNNGSDE